MIKFRVLFDQATDSTGGGAATATTTIETPASAAAPTTTAGGAAQVPASSSAASSTPAQPAADWIAGLSKPELQEYAKMKGFKDPSMLVDSYQNLEKLMGAPRDRLVTLPEKADAPEWQQVFQRLGKPEKADGYKIDALKEAGAAPEFLEWAKGAFHGADMTASQAEKLVKGWNEFNQAAAQKQQAELAAKGEASQTELKTKWGNAYDQNLNVAKAGAAEFGVTAEMIDSMEKSMGTVATMEFFQKIGSKLGEAAFQSGGQGSGFGRMAPDVAQAHLAAKKADTAFMQKYMSGDAAAKKEMGDLFRDAYPGEITI